MFWKFAERILAQLVSTIVAIELARILVPEDYAVVSIVAIFFTFCNVFISSGLNTALIQKKDSDILDYSTILYANIAISAVLYAVMFFTSPLIAKVYDEPLLVPVIRVMGLSFFINGIKAVVCAKISNDLQFKKFFAATLSGTVFSAVLGITMALKGFGAWALVAQQMSNSLIDTVILLFVSGIRFVPKFSAARFKSLFDYGYKIFLAGIINTAYEETRPLVVGIKFTSVDLAFYNKGQLYPKLINSTLSDTLASVLFPVMSKVQTDVEALQAMTKRFIRICSYVVFPIMLGLFAVSDNLVIVLLKEKWAPIIIYVKIFSLTSILSIIQSGNLLPIRAIGRSDMILKLDIIKKTIYFIILVAFILFSKSPVILAPMGFLTNTIAFAINAYANQSLLGYRIGNQIVDIVENLFPAAIMCLIVVFMNRIPLPRILLLCLQVLTGAAIFCALSILFKNSNFRYLLDYAKQFYGKLKA